MTNTMEKTLPKAPFPEIGRFYEALVTAGVQVGSLNKDRADSLIRILSRTTWKDANQDIYSIWNANGENWNQLIKDVKSYSKAVSKAGKKSPKPS